MQIVSQDKKDLWVQQVKITKNSKPNLTVKKTDNIQELLPVLWN